jgi:drug/metabolite transporter (DMT)-like permease
LKSNQFKESFKRNRTGILLMVLTSVCISFGQLFWKLAHEQGIILLLPGFLLYGAGAALMITAYRFGSLSVLHPVLSLNYVLALILGYFLLGEKIGAGRLTGVAIIILGVIMICGGDD